MRTLQLSLKKQWFELTKAGIKTEDYREITPYWVTRLLYKHREDMTTEGFIRYIESETHNSFYADNFSFKRFSSNKMTLGYPKSTDTERILLLEHKGIEIGQGKEEWGAENGKLYFIIKHGKILDL